MKNIKRVFLDLFYKSGKILSQKHRGFISAALGVGFGLVYHTCFLILFYQTGIMPMFFFNFFSVSCFAILLFVLFKFKKVNTAYFVTTGEVIVHQILAEYFLGAYSGFHFLIFIMVVFPFLVEKKGFNIGIPASFICLIIFIACEFIFSRITPVYEVSQEILRNIRFVNIVASMCVVLTMIIIFKLIIDYIEKTLEEMNIKNEELLENILPKKVVEELRDNGCTNPEHYNNVSILFTDIVGFTDISKKMQPHILIKELNEIFTNFDLIIEKYNCVRIKTIGDAYMAVCGLPNPDEKSAKNMVSAALECRKYLEERNKTADYKWTIRLGIHTGEVVAGIVGVKKYIYDVFGDAVNVASRMETSSEEMRINVSEAVFEQVKDDFKFTSRGEKEIKGKGLMKLYFVDSGVNTTPEKSINC